MSKKYSVDLKLKIVQAYLQGIMGARVLAKKYDVSSKSLDKSKQQAEQLLAQSKAQYETIFDEFFVGLDSEVRKKCYSTIHAATLTQLLAVHPFHSPMASC